MSAGKGKRRPKRAQRASIALARRVNLERERLFKAMSVIACCRLACASLLDQGGNLELMADALQAPTISLMRQLMLLRALAPGLPRAE